MADGGQEVGGRLVDDDRERVLGRVPDRIHRDVARFEVALASVGDLPGQGAWLAERHAGWGGPEVENLQPRYDDRDLLDDRGARARGRQGVGGGLARGHWQRAPGTYRLSRAIPGQSAAGGAGGGPGQVGRLAGLNLDRRRGQARDRQARW